MSFQNGLSAERLELIRDGELAADGQEVVAAHDEPKPRVVRRDKVGRASSHTGKRFSNIISCYIPMAGPGAASGDAAAPTERCGLLDAATEEEEEEPAANDVTATTELSAASLAEATLRGGAVFQAETLLELGELPAAAELETGDICNVAVLRTGELLLSFSHSYTLARVVLATESAPAALHPFSVAVKGEPLLPADVRAHHGRLFVSGSLQRGAALSSVLVECAPDGQVLRATKELPYPKFAGFDVDPEGDLVVASPMQTSVQGDVQVFKMSADFRRKLFKIELGGRRTRYKPQFVACQTATNTCWVSAQRSEGDGTLARSGRTPNKTRLLTFPIRNPAAADEQLTAADGQPAVTPTREWLKVASWKFHNVDPGRIAAFGQHVLVLDATNGNLLCVSRTADSAAEGDPQHMCQPVTAPSQEGGPHFTALCVDPAEPDTVLAATADTIYKLTLRL